MGIISWIILGLLAGAIAKILLPGRDPGGLIGTTLIGVAGAFIGGWISPGTWTGPSPTSSTTGPLGPRPSAARSCC